MHAHHSSMPAPWEVSMAQDIRQGRARLSQMLPVTLACFSWRGCGGQPGHQTGAIRSACLYLLRPGLQLLLLLQVDLPHTGQQVMRGHEDPGAQEKREDVCSLKKKRKGKGEKVKCGSSPVRPMSAAPLGPAGSKPSITRQQRGPAWFTSPWMPRGSKAQINPTLQWLKASLVSSAPSSLTPQGFSSTSVLPQDGR